MTATKRNPSDDEEEQEDMIKETEEMKEKSLQQLREAIDMLPEEEREALEEAQSLCPDLVERESNPLCFLRFHSFNSWAAAKRLANYWTFRKEALGNRAFLPMDLSGKGAIPLEDVRMLQTGVIVHLPKDLEGRSVVYVDRSKLLENETMSPCMLFFTLQKIMENEVTYKKGYISLINLSNPFGSMFERENVTRFKDYIRKAMPIKVGTIHIVCSPPGEGMSSFVSSFLPLCLQRLGPFFSKYALVHVASSEEEVFQRLQEHKLVREGLPPFFGGTWNGFDDWLVSQKCKVERNLHVNAIVRNTLWAYSETVGNSVEDKRSGMESHACVAADEELLRDRVKYAHFDIRDYTEDQHRGVSLEEREVILRDIYGTTDVEFTITKEIEMEGRARQQFDEAIKLLPEEDVRDYQEAKEVVPHLVEIESDPGRFLRIENYNAWNAARRVALYWKNRKEVFGERAFLPLTLSGNSALKEDEIAMVKTGYMTIMPDDDRGRPIYYHDLSRLTVPFTGESRTRCAFYIMQLISERESSRNAGAIGIAAYTKNAPKGATNPKHGRKATEMARDGVFPCHWRAIHVCAVGMKSNTLRDKYFIPFTMQMLRFWKALSLRTIVHVDEKPDGIRSCLQKYGVPPSCVPTTVGGTWTYENDFKKWYDDRVELEKERYWSGESQNEVESKIGQRPLRKSKSVDVDNEHAQRIKKRKMDAIYARRKRERQRIEIEVLQERCVEFNNKNSALAKQNKWLEELLKNANDVVSFHTSGSAVMPGNGMLPRASNAFGSPLFYHRGGQIGSLGRHGFS